MEYQECRNEECGNPVFARGICRKHYDQERQREADPCSVEGCNAKSTKRGMCEAHYQAWRIKQNPICSVNGCSAHAKGKKYGLCVRHEFRYRKHQSFKQPRPDDWGAREVHPLYKIWAYRRRGKGSCELWRKDFWAFVNAVGPDRPSNHTLRRKNLSKPLGPDNWYWKESIDSSDRAKYAKTFRANNARLSKNAKLKQIYGITIYDYERMFDEQGGVCKICGNPEKRIDKNGSATSLAVDHCHETGKVRGLLCKACNMGVGYFQDNPDLLRKAALYLDGKLLPNINLITPRSVQRHYGTK